MLIKLKQYSLLSPVQKFQLPVPSFNSTFFKSIQIQLNKCYIRVSNVYTHIHFCTSSLLLSWHFALIYIYCSQHSKIHVYICYMDPLFSTFCKGDQIPHMLTQLHYQIEISWCHSNPDLLCRDCHLLIDS